MLIIFQSLIVSNDGERLVATNRYDHSISVFDKQLNIIKVHHESLPQRKLDTCTGFGIDADGIIYLQEGTNIIATALGGNCRTLLSNEDGIHFKGSAAYDQQLRRIVIGYPGSDRLKIWQL